MNSFRNQSPVRNCNKVYSNYRNYKKNLSDDFNQRCGYCDDFDGWGGGIKSYHIDHFAPKSKFSFLENTYDNLVYACSFCNRFKSNDWPSGSHLVSQSNNKGYIDPCDAEYDNHFSRDIYGNIKPKNELAVYMHEKLQLYLIRHRTIWNLTRLKKQIDLMSSFMDSIDKDSDKYFKLRDIYCELNLEFHKYLDYLLGRNNESKEI